MQVRLCRPRCRWIRFFPDFMESSLNMKRVLITGNKDYGLAKALAEAFPEATFISRSTSGTDLKRHDDQVEVAKLSLEYDVYISCSCLSQFRQTLLLEKIYQAWREHSKTGQILCLGSSADTPVKGHGWLYPIEKKALKAYCRNLSMEALGGHGQEPSGLRVTYLSPGYLQTPKAEEKHPGVEKINVQYLAKMIQWILDQPTEININEISLDPIQLNGGVRK